MGISMAENGKNRGLLNVQGIESKMHIVDSHS